MSQVTSSSLIAAVAALPEIYQPIYGHEELSAKVSRRCVDRLAHIVQVHEAMKRRLQRPLKVLDLGCSQGFFSCSLAAQGAQVVGIDHTAQNIRVCEELARESPSLQLEFVHGSVEDFIAASTPGRFDLVLGLSVFHHIVHERGIGFVTDLLGRLSELVEVGVFEMALPTEGPYWSASQPPDPRQLLDSYSFVLEVGKVETHLSMERRPIYAASRTLAVLGEEAFRFDEVRTQSHALADNTHVGTRRYYLSDSTVIKLFRVDGAIADHNRAELERESDFLATHGEALPFLPRLLAHGTGPAEAWLVREKLPGRLLMDLIADGSVFDGQTLVTDVLEQATALESLGLYHGDLRTWNVLVDPDDRAVLIDYGAIQHTRADNVWPDDVFLAFFVFLHEVAHRRVVRVLPVRAPFISPFNLPFPYRELAAWLWELPAGSWSFAGLKDRWADLTSSATSVTVSSGNGLWQGAVERYLLALADSQDEGRSTHRLQSSALESAIRRLSESSAACSDDLDELRRSNLAHVSRFEQSDRLLAALEAEAAQADAHRAELAAELRALALRLDAADITRDAALAHLEASIGELREQVQTNGLEAQRSGQSLAERLDRVAAESDRTVEALSKASRLQAEEARRDATVHASNIERHFVEVEAALRTEQVAVDALVQEFETLRRSPWRLWWPGTKPVSPPPLTRPERAANGARPAESRSALDAPAIASVAPQTPVLPPEVRAMRSDEASDGQDVLVQPDNEQFVASTYRMVLGREADPEGQDHYVRQLERGAQRWEVLAALAKSDEAGNRRVLWSDVAIALLSAREGGVRRSVLSEEAERRDSTASAVGAESLPGSVSELLELHDEQFVRTCFMTLLRRPADPEGLGNYLRQVRAGISKSQIVAALVSSPEGGKIEHTLPGLAPLVEAERRARPNVLQRLLRRLGRSLFYPVEVRLNALENRLYCQMGSAGDAVARRPRGSTRSEAGVAGRLQPELAMARLDAKVTAVLAEAAPGSLPPRTRTVLRRLLAIATLESH